MDAGTSAASADETDYTRTADLTSSSPSSDLNDLIDRLASSGGGIVLVPGGEHRLDGDVVVRSNVTLRGRSMLGSVLDLDGHTVCHEPGAEGAAIEDLTLASGGTGLCLEAGASYCILRRLRIRDSRRQGILLQGGGYDRMYLEMLFLERSGSHAIELAPDRECRSVFLSDVSIDGFGESGRGHSDGIRVSGRCHINQVHIDPVRPGDRGIAFLPGSEYSTLSNYYVHTRGDGRAVSGQDENRVAVASGTVQSE